MVYAVDKLLMDIHRFLLWRSACSVRKKLKSHLLSLGKVLFAILSSFLDRLLVIEAWFAKLYIITHLL